MMHTSACRQRGFTLIELMVVVAIAAILLTLAAPSFTGYMNKKRVEGVAAELATDIQFARTEAVVRNAPVRITFGSGCWVVHTAGSTATTCTQAAGATLGTGATQLKDVQLASNLNASLSPNNSLTYIAFDAVRAMSTSDGGGTSHSIDVNSSSGSWQLRTAVSSVGRVQVCSPNGSVPGYATSC
jgi:type IV fimbrial biogenesis protein FimT